MSIPVPELVLPFEIPQMIHPLFVHFAIALPVILLILEIVNLVAKRKLLSGINFFFMLLIVAVYAGVYFTGLADAQGVELEALNAHKQLGIYLLYGSAVVLLFKLISMVVNKIQVKIFFYLALMAFIATSFIEGKKGGELVYKYGVNVKAVNSAKKAKEETKAPEHPEAKVVEHKTEEVKEDMSKEEPKEEAKAPEHQEVKAVEHKTEEVKEDMAKEEHKAEAKEEPKEETKAPEHQEAKAVEHKTEEVKEDMAKEEPKAEAKEESKEETKAPEHQEAKAVEHKTEEVKEDMAKEEPKAEAKEEPKEETKAPEHQEVKAVEHKTEEAVKDIVENVKENTVEKVEEKVADKVNNLTH